MSSSTTHTPARGKTTPASSGGSFKPGTNTLPDDVLPAQSAPPELPGQHLRAQAAVAKRIAAAAAHAEHQVNAEVLTASLREYFPDGTHAVFARSWDDDDGEQELALVYAGDDVIYRKDEWSSGGRVDPREHDINQLAQNFGTEFGTYTTGVLATGPDVDELLSDGDVYTHSFSKEAHKGSYHFNIPDTVGLDKMTRNEVETLTFPIDEILGRPDVVVDKGEVEYLLTEGSDFHDFDPELMPKLEAKFGDMEKALDAVVDTKVWADMTERIQDRGTAELREHLVEAVEEALAVGLSPLWCADDTPHAAHSRRNEWNSMDHCTGRP